MFDEPESKGEAILRSAAKQVVVDFCAAWSALDFDRIETMLADDLVYHNIPLEPILGRASANAYFRNLAPSLSWCRWELISIAAEGSTVLTERVDHFHRDGRAVALQVMGVFEIERGLIARWRDYFDLASYRNQLARRGHDETGIGRQECVGDGG